MTSRSCHLEAAVHLCGALLKLVLRAQEASSKKAIGDAVEDERSFEDVEDVHASPVSRRVKILRLLAYPGDRCRDIDREVCTGVACEDGIDFTLGNGGGSLPLQKVDDEWDVGLRDFVVAGAAGVAVRRNDGGGPGWRLEHVVHLVQRHELLAIRQVEVRDTRGLGFRCCRRGARGRWCAGIARPRA